MGMSLLNEFQLQAIRDFRNAVYELLEELDNHASIELVTVETCMEELLEAWETMKAQLSDEDDRDAKLSTDLGVRFVLRGELGTANAVHLAKRYGGWWSVSVMSHSLTLNGFWEEQVLSDFEAPNQRFASKEQAFEAWINRKEEPPTYK